MTYFLGIDGGGSGCRAVLTDATGNVMGRATAGPANIASDPDGARDNILRAAYVAAKDVPLDRVHAGLGLAGAYVAGAADRLRGQLPFASARIETDAVTATLGALDGRYGIVAAIGTGSVYTRYDETGITQIGGRGFAVGDEAGGAWLGREAVSNALHAADGLRASSPFLDGIVNRFGGVDATVSWAVTAKAADFASLAPVVIDSDDLTAQALLQNGADYILSSIAALQLREPLPVTLIGGLGPTYHDYIERRWPVIAPMGTSLDGALQLARNTA